ETDNGSTGTICYLYALSSTDDDGMISWSCLDQESYYLKELAAPDGYVITESGALQLLSNTDFTYGSVGLTLANKYLEEYELPLCGGSGTGRFALIGLALIGGAGLLYFYRRRMTGI
ncbi:MAG: LPXTG cell wall anchor domain-containing protein, partial [Lachnospiraceae bacterium]|nr:LPXTG cell wall anchor domain-containing protein [Lachnospiraceae bacterium]